MITGFATTGTARTPKAKHSVTERDNRNRLFRLRKYPKLSKCPPMITNFANAFALTHFDIMSKLIWASKTVRLISRKKPKA